jgi:putative ABC transport system permease protein
MGSWLISAALPPLRPEGKLMWAYQFESAVRSLRRYPVLSSLIVLAIALGLAAATSTLTLVQRLGDDPVPGKSQNLYAVSLDAWDSRGWNNSDGQMVAPDQLTYRDLMAMWERAPAEKQAPMYRTYYTLQPDNVALPPSVENARATSRHFFDMFAYPFSEGGTWSEQDDKVGTDVVVLSAELKQTLFGNTPALGQRLQLNGDPYQVIGVLAPMDRLISAHDLTNGPLREQEGLYTPLRTALRHERDSAGNNNCWSASAPGWKGKLESECIWMQFWAELKSPDAIAKYRQFMDGYADEQKKLGRFPRTTRNNVVIKLTDWMIREEVVSNDQRLASFIGIGFLLVALVNAACLLLAKFLRGARESAVHRALGASKRMIFRQHLLESILIGAMSAVGALVISSVVLFGIRRFDAELANVAQLDLRMLAVLVLLSVIGTLIAGAFPAWRVSRLAPAASLRSN